MSKKAGKGALQRGCRRGEKEGAVVWSFDWFYSNFVMVYVSQARCARAMTPMKYSTKYSAAVYVHIGIY
jgi:hypothetical protein